jgi:hypothetical protein
MVHSVTLAVSRENDGKLRLVCAGWDDAKVGQPDEVVELRASSQRGGRDGISSTLVFGGGVEWINGLSSRS